MVRLNLDRESLVDFPELLKAKDFFAQAQALGHYQVDDPLNINGLYSRQYTYFFAFPRDATWAIPELSKISKRIFQAIGVSETETPGLKTPRNLDRRTEPFFYFPHSYIADPGIKSPHDFLGLLLFPSQRYTEQVIEAVQVTHSYDPNHPVIGEFGRMYGVEPSRLEEEKQKDLQGYQRWFLQPVQQLLTAAVRHLPPID